jgi:HPt (histidine-containing phosphotransfer) domain-containing protein
VTGREAAPDNLPVALAASPLPVAPLFSSPYLDVDGAVERLSGMTSLYLDVLQDFIRTLDTVEEEFRQAGAPGNVKALMSQMHSLKGISATLGANPLSEHAALLEKLFRNPPVGLVALDQLPDLLALVQASQTAGLQAVQCLQAAQNAPPEWQSKTAGPVERAAAQAFLRDLSALLRASNLSALDCFKQRGHVLDVLPASDVEEMRLALQALDLEAARRLCDMHIAALVEAIS